MNNGQVITRSEFEACSAGGVNRLINVAAISVQIVAGGPVFPEIPFNC